MNKHLATLVNVIQKGNGWDSEGETVNVSRTSRTAGGVYERVRNAVEYEEEHLLRRNAIRRILGRRRAADQEEMTGSRGELLIKELIWAKYLPNKKIPVKKISEIDAVVDKYDGLFNVVPEGTKEGQELNDWLFDMLSTEIEYTLDPPRSAETLATMMFDTMKSSLTWDEGSDLKAEQKDMLSYIAIHRALLKSNIATLRYRVFTLYFPKWNKPTSAMLRDVEKRLPSIVRTIEAQIKHPYADQLYRLMRRYALVFWAIEDVVKEKPEAALDIFQDDDKLKRYIGNAVGSRYKTFRKKLYRVVGRAVLFLFITKMLLALILELPYDLYVLGGIEWLPLGINIAFHPIFLAIIGITIRIPTKRNTARVIDLVRSIVNEDDSEARMEVIFRIKRPWTQGVLGKFFTTMYTFTFVLTYGLIGWFLSTVLHFNVLSITLFLFFFSLVTFFGIKIRQSVHELLVVQRQGGVIGTLFDFFLLPVVRVGRWISLQSPKVNVFIFFLDFIVEAPFKLAIEMVEGWVAFTREKKEEL